MAHRHRSKLIKFQTGERFPVLLGQDGMPLFLPNYYLVSMCRGKNDAVNTISAKMNAIKHLYTWSSVFDINIEDRFRRGNLFRIEEIESLVHAIKMNYKNLYKIKSVETSRKYNSKTINLEKYRMMARQQDVNYVCHQTQTFRLRTIIDYLKWLVIISMSRVLRDTKLYQNTMAAREEMISLLEARRAHGHRPTQSRLLAPEGFSVNVQNRIIEVVEPDHPENPWSLPFSKVRNQVYLLMAITTGLRLGEALCIKLHDIDFANQTFRIVRRPDDPDDPRSPKPEVKTRQRHLPISGWLRLLRGYVRSRSALPRAKRNPYLFVSKYGTPLTISGASEIFVELRKGVPDLPDNLSQHMVRKAWNERLSDFLESIDTISQEHKDFMRKYLMGWSRNSKMPERYNLAYIMREAEKLCNKLNKKAMAR